MSHLLKHAWQNIQLAIHYVWVKIQFNMKHWISCVHITNRKWNPCYANIKVQCSRIFFIYLKPMRSITSTAVIGIRVCACSQRGWLLKPRCDVRGGRLCDIPPGLWAKPVVFYFLEVICDENAKPNINGLANRLLPCPRTLTPHFIEPSPSSLSRSIRLRSINRSAMERMTITSRGHCLFCSSYLLSILSQTTMSNKAKVVAKAICCHWAIRYRKSYIEIVKSGIGMALGATGNIVANFYARLNCTVAIPCNTIPFFLFDTSSDR
jgi:hypothetical protein